MMEKYIISKLKTNSFFEKKNYSFCQCGIDLRLWYSRSVKKFTLLTMYYHSTI
jgi:hypothetical protein